MKAVNDDGTEVALDTDAFEKIATAIKLETGSEISQKNDSFTMKRGDIEASTKFPISFNVATKTFTVQTPNGEQEVKVLPDEAVQKVLTSKEITDLTNGGATSPVVLTEFNNQPVYQIEGTNNKRLFAFFPVTIPKTTYLSAQNGNVVSSSQSFGSRVLNALSF